MEPGLQNSFPDRNAIARGLHFLGEKFGAALRIDSKDTGDIPDAPAETITAQQVRAAGLHPPDLFHVKGGHVFDFGQRWRPAIQSLRLQTIEGLIVTEEFGKLAVNQNIPAGSVHTKEG